MTRKQTRALQILALQPMSAAYFAKLYFLEPCYQYLFTSVSNQGNGSCAGKKAWLAAGSLLAKLEKKDLVRHYTRQSGRIGPRGGIGYYSGYEITPLGLRLLSESPYWDERLLILRKRLPYSPHLEKTILEIESKKIKLKCYS